jgi:putative transposase
MPNYRRAVQPGGTFFFTLVTENRAPLFTEESNRLLLRRAIAACRHHRPFTLDAIVLLPDHLHLLITLPDDDTDYSTRLSVIKSDFTRHYLAAGGHEQPRSPSRLRQEYRGVWQRRFWEHTIADPDDLHNHLDYIHYNPVHHELTTCPHTWPHTSFHQFVARNDYLPDWCCVCNGRMYPPPNFDSLPIADME